MNTFQKYGLLFAITLFSLNCGSDGGQAINIQSLNDDAALSEAKALTGDATGTDASGGYDLELTELQFSKTCTTDMVIENDFYIDLGLSEVQIATIISNGYSDASAKIRLTQKDGQITFRDVGIDFEDATGPFYADGDFQAVDGVYFDFGQYVIAIKGTIDQMSQIV